MAIITLQGSGKTSGVDSLVVNVTGENSYDGDGDNLTCFWDYGDGTTSDKCNPNSYKYGWGEFRLVLTVTDSLGGRGQDQLKIKVVPPTNQGGGSIQPTLVLQQNYSQQIKINEILPNPSGKDAEGEWIELWNQGDDLVDLTGWKIDDAEGGSKAYSLPWGTLIYPKQFFVVKSQKSGLVLNNDEDEVRLFDPKGELKDSLFYREVKENQSYQKQVDGTWVWGELTEGKANLVKEKEIKPNTEVKLALYAVMPNPNGEDKKQEWIQVFNPNSFEVNLKNWQIQTLKKSALFEKDFWLKSQAKIKLMTEDLSLTLTNQYEELSLVNPSGQIIDQLIWREALSGRIYKHQTDLTEHTEDEVIIMEVIDGDTIVVNLNGQKEKVRLIGLDTPETVHPEKTVERFGKQASAFTQRMLLGKTVLLKYEQEKRDKYGRILAYVYLSDGRMFNRILLQEGYAWVYPWFDFVYKSGFEQEEQKAREKQKGLWKKETRILEIIAEIKAEKPPEEVWEEIIVLEEETPKFENFDFNLIQISEIYPNTTEGDQENEWIELENKGEKNFDLTGWKIDDVIEKGSEPYSLPVGTVIPARGFLLIHSRNSKLALNNGGDSVNLLNPYGAIQDKMSYTKTKKGTSWARNLKNRFLLTQLKTPNQKNIIAPLKIKKDTDLDGLTDFDEINFYHTDPQKIDTNGNGIPDGFEVYNFSAEVGLEKKLAMYAAYLEKISDFEYEAQSGQIVLKGKTEANALVRLFIHSKLIVGLVRADKEGKWEYKLDSNLEAGQHKVEAELMTVTGIKTQRKNVVNFDLDQNLIVPEVPTSVKISTILPNPKGKDELSEYFEVWNAGQKKVNLENWEIRNQKNQVYRFGSIWLETQAKQKFYYTETKLTLNNTQGFLTLFNSQKRRTDFLAYRDVQEGEIFTHAGGNLQKKAKTTKPKKIKKDEIYLEKLQIKGLVLSEINLEQNFFWFKTESDQEIRIFFDEKKIPLTWANLFFNKGNEILLTGEYQTENSFILSDFVLLKEFGKHDLPAIKLNQKSDDHWWWLMFFSLGFVYFYFRRKILIQEKAEMMN